MRKPYQCPEMELIPMSSITPLALSAGIGGMVEEGETNEFIF